MNRKRIHWLNICLVNALVTLAITFQASAQQSPQYTQYRFNGLVLNPAYAGAEGPLSLTLLHRMQWVGVDGAPITQTFSAHSLVKKKSMGMGLSLVNDKIGVHKNLSAMFSYAYHIPVAKASWLSLGIQAGLQSLKSDYGSLSDGTIDPMVAAATTSITSFDLGTGLYFRSPRLQIGFSVPHLLPQHAVVNDSMKVQWDRLNYFLFSKYSIPLTNNVDLEPSVLLKYFANAPLSLDINVMAAFYKVISFGLSYRLAESAGFLLRAKVTPQLDFGYAYDLPIGTVSKAGSGAHEIMLQYRFHFEHTKVDSPR